MIEAGQHGGLAVELLATFVAQALGEVGVVVDLLDGADTTGQATIFGLVDGAHPAATDGMVDDVAVAQRRAGSERGSHGGVACGWLEADDRTRGDYTCAMKEALGGRAWAATGSC